MGHVKIAATVTKIEALNISQVGHICDAMTVGEFQFSYAEDEIGGRINHAEKGYEWYESADERSMFYHPSCETSFTDVQ
jgi:hypothetical protein